MATAFSRTLRSLHADGSGRSRASVLAATCLVVVWGAWCVLARISLYEITTTARIEVDHAVAPIESPVSGRVVAVRLGLAREVHTGDLLVELDAEAEQRQIREQRVRLASLAPRLRALQEQIAAEEQAGVDEQMAGSTAAEAAGVEVRQAEAPAAFAEEEEERIRQLRKYGLIAEREYSRSRAEAQKFRAAAESQQLVVRHLVQEQRMRQSDRQVQLKSLHAEMTGIESSIPEIEATIARLENEVERRRIRAPLGGRLAEAAVLRPGAFVQEGQKLGAIVPPGRLAVVAQFAPPAALGKIRPGQPARLRLHGFPWMQYGSIPATVTRVAGEVRDNSVRVELALNEHPPADIPLQHGLPGTVEVEVERVTPAALILRSAGNVFAEPRVRSRDKL
jgi:multidrug resistance efflux pump